MFEKKVPEKMIIKRSGHLSVGGLLSYEHSTMAQKKEVCNVLQNAPQGSYTDEDKQVDWDKNGKGADDSDKKTIQDDSAAEVLRNMQFSNMSGCLFNFSLH